MLGKEGHQVLLGVNVLSRPVNATPDPGLRNLTQVQTCKYRHPIPGVCLDTFRRKSVTHPQSRLG